MSRSIVTVYQPHIQVAVAAAEVSTVKILYIPLKMHQPEIFF